MNLHEAFHQQARSNANLGSPFTARILSLLAENLQPGTALTDRLFGWEGELGPIAQSVPLRLLAGLHALVLTKACPDLVTIYPPYEAPDDGAIWSALQVAMRDHADTLNHWLDNPPQTNEVRRAAVLIAAGHWLSAHYGLPIHMSELGASGGLNLMWDEFALDVPRARLGPSDAPVILSPDWHGDLPIGITPTIIDRRGVDLIPLDARDPDDALRLQSYLWADQPERLARTRAAISIFDAKVDRGDAADWLEARLANNRPDHLALIYHTIAWQYFPEETQERCRATISKAGQRGPVAHLSMEADERHGKGAAITLTLWPEGRSLTLGRVDFHGRWVDWRSPCAQCEN